MKRFKHRWSCNRLEIENRHENRSVFVRLNRNLHRVLHVPVLVNAMFSNINELNSNQTNVYAWIIQLQVVVFYPDQVQETRNYLHSKTISIEHILFLLLLLFILCHRIVELILNMHHQITCQVCWNRHLMKPFESWKYLE